MSEKTAWQKYDEKDFQIAEQIWDSLIKNEANQEKKQNLLLNKGYALVAQKKYQEAENLYKTLYEQTKSHIYLHQLCMVYREKGTYEEALAYLKLEKSMIKNGDSLSLGTNLYEFGKIYELLGKYDEAREFAQKCVVYALKTKDDVMKGCAYRLMGDIQAHINLEKSLVFFKQAKHYFRQAKDLIAVDEVNKNIRDLKRCTVK